MIGDRLNPNGARWETNRLVASVLRAGGDRDQIGSGPNGMLTGLSRSRCGHPRPVLRLPVILSPILSLPLLFAAAGCTAGPMSEQAAIATATACACGCFPYGSRHITEPSVTPTPTGTWVPPRPTSTPTPTRPVGGSYATLVPRQPTESPAWPPPAVTCTAAPDQPTLTPRPTLPAPVFPTFPANTPMPSGGSGTSEGRALASMSGNAGIGQPAIDPRTGAPSFVWSQDNTNQATDAQHRVYLRRMDPQSRTLEVPRSVNILEPKVGFKTTYLDSAVALTSDGAVHVLYCERRAGTGLTDALYRRSADGKSNWSEPVRVGGPSPGWCNNVRLRAAPDGTLLAAWTGGNPDNPAKPDSSVRVWRRSPQGAWADVSPPRMTSGRQYESDLAFLDMPEAQSGYRAFLIFDDGNNVYATYSDRGDDPGNEAGGGYWREPVQLVNSDVMNGRLGILDYWPSSLRLLAFSYQGRAFVYAFWSLYSTGRLAYVYSSDAGAPGGPRWTREDTFAYFPPLPGDPLPTPPADRYAGEEGEEAVLAPNPATALVSDLAPSSQQAQSATTAPKVHMPQPFWVPERQRVLVVYRYGTVPTALGVSEAGVRQYYAAYAYSLPDAAGSAWAGAVGPQFGNRSPLRAFPPTQYEAMDQLQGAGALDSTGAAWVSWMERGASKEAFFGAIWPYTLISANNQP